MSYDIKLGKNNDGILHILRIERKIPIIWPNQLCKKLVKETIFNIWRKDKYFLVLPIWQNTLQKSCLQ